VSKIEKLKSGFQANFVQKPRPHIGKQESPSAPGDRVTLGSTRNAPSCQPVPAPEKKKWTLLYYLAGNNNIADDMIIKMSRMERYGSDENVNIVTQMAQPQNSPFPGVTRFLVAKNPSPAPELLPPKIRGKVYHSASPVVIENLPTLVSNPVEKLGSLDMAEPGTLSDFIKWGVKNYPAEHYAVVIMNHGYGFLGAVEDDISGKLMSIPEINSALSEARKQTGVKLDILGFDACLMQQAEVAHQLKDTAKFLVASEEVEYPFGWPEGKLIGRLQDELKKGEVCPRRFAKIIVEECGKESDACKAMSAVNLKIMKNLGKAIDRLAVSLMKSSISREKLRDIITSTQNYCNVIPDEKLCRDYRDLYNFCQRIIASPDIKDKDVMESALRTIDLIQKAVVAETHPGEGIADSHGLSIYLPTKGILDEYEGRDARIHANPKDAYKKLSLSRQTSWDEMLENIGEEKKPS